MVFIHAVSLDGREVTETEKIFLLKWKEMRRARIKQGKKLMSDTTVESSSHTVHPHKNSKKIMPVHPLSMPALPARQLPRKSKSKHQQNQLPLNTDHEYSEIDGAVASTWIGDAAVSEATHGAKTHKITGLDPLRTNRIAEKPNTKDDRGDSIKLPEIIPHQSLIAQSGNILPELTPDNLRRKLWQASQKIPAKVFE